MQAAKWPALEEISIASPMLPSPPSRALGQSRQMGQQASAYHAGKITAEPIFASCLLSSELCVSGIGNLWRGGARTILPNLTTSYWQRAIQVGELELQNESNLPVRNIEVPCICPVGWGYNIYGHVVIEILPRLLLARKWALQKGLCDAAILLPDDAPAWINPILSSFGILEEEIIRYSPKTEQVRLLRGIFPYYLYRSYGFHPLVADLLDEWLPTVKRSDNRDGVLFIARPTEWNPATRRCANEADLIAIAQEEFGCSVIQPETLSFPQQILAFNNAAGVIGLYGSGLHNAIFTDKGLHVGIIGMKNLAQSHIAALRQQPISYFNNGINISGNYVVDVKLFTHFMRGYFSSRGGRKGLMSFF